MLTIEKFVTASPEQWEIIIEGMRNPMNSWSAMDSDWDGDMPGLYRIGDNDYDLMMNLAHAGKDHAKYRRMIPVHMTINAPLYWWKEFDTYKVGTTSNSCSTMHKIHTKEFTLDDFSVDHLMSEDCDLFHVEWCNGLFNRDINPMEFFHEYIVHCLNVMRQKFLETNDKNYWWQMIQLLPSSYNQKRTIALNYEVLYNIYHARRNHKLDEWHVLCDWIESLPYSEIITMEE